jgi:hypothetical protein
MNYLPLPDSAARQLIDSTTVFTEYRRVRAQAQPYAGTMYWKQEGAYEYLVKTRPRRRSQERVGARSAQTESIFNEFSTRKQAFEARLKSLREALTEAERLNKALKVGRTPALAITLLQVLDDAGLSPHFTVVGTHALYAYETAASVRIVTGALATQDVDLLWDARKRVQFMTEIDHLDASMLSVLKRADPTFERKEGQNGSAVNAGGFEVDFLPVRGVRTGVLPRFEHAVISATGRMALMRTVVPSVFVEFRRWMEKDAPQREEVELRRDRLQADIVQELLDQKLLVA